MYFYQDSVILLQIFTHFVTHRLALGKYKRELNRTRNPTQQNLKMIY